MNERSAFAAGCPFRPGHGLSPPLLAGRGDETGLLERAIKRLLGPRAKDRRRLQRPALPSFKIVGPRGAGKTALLDWARRRAQEKGIRSVSVKFDQADSGEEQIAKLLASMKAAMGVLNRLAASVGAMRLGGVDITLGRARRAEEYQSQIGALVAEGPLLLLLDEAQNFDPDLLAQVLYANQLLIRDGYPLAVVMAGRPGLNRNLMKEPLVYYDYREQFHLSALDDDATRAALREPFEQAGVKVTPAALQAMAAQTDNYPYFIQLVGREAWHMMAKAGRRDIDVELVRQAGAKAREGRGPLYAAAYQNMSASGLLPYARQVLKMIEGGDGHAKSQRIVEMLIDSNADVDNGRAHEIRSGLLNEGFIWSPLNDASPGMPSFFDYFKREEGI